MRSRTTIRGMPFGATLAIALLAGPMFAATPSPPAGICIDGSCKPDTQASPGTGIRYHTGTYLWYYPGADSNGIGGGRIDLATQRTQLLSFINTVCSNTNIKGFKVAAAWRALEGDSAGDYSVGFSAVDAILAKLTSCKKRLMLDVGGLVLYGNARSNYDLWPAYLINGSNYGITPFQSPQTGATARFWQGATMDRYIALSQAYGARYNGNSSFEMVSLGGEPSLSGVPGGLDGFSTSGALAQWTRWVQATRAAWPNVAIRLPLNDLTPDSSMSALLATCATNACSIGGPDVWPDDITQADRVFAGLNSSHQSVYTDYRDIMPWVAEAEWQTFQTKSDGTPRFTMSQIWGAPTNGYTSNSGFALPSMKEKYFVWYVNEVNGNDSTQWSGAILPYINSTRGAVYTPAACPSSYSTYGGCNSN